MSHLVLHIDVEFIVGAVCADKGTSFPINNGNEELMWLYFFNNPHQNRITFGKENKRHFNNSEVNYYGKFFEKIEKEEETFALRGVEHPVIDLLEESGLLGNIRKTYQQKAFDNAENIPTLITFSSSIGDNAKQKTVDYLKKRSFKIDSYTIPLAELTCYHSLNNKISQMGTGSIAIFLEATNITLHLIKLSLSDNYFLMDGKPNSWRGKGLDPRKRALVRFVVNEVNKATGILSTDDEKENECERLEMQADEWLKRLDAQTKNIPLRIPAISFTKAPNMRRDVLVRKDDLDSDTGQYTQELKDIFDAFKSDNVRGDVAAVFLLGNCFQSDRVKGSFEQMIGREKLYFYANKDIQDILTMYLKIDIKRYADEEERIKARAKAEEQKQAEQRALEDKKRKEQEAEQKRLASEQKIEENRREAKKLFERAVELNKQGKLEDARVNAENALSLDKTNKEYNLFLTDLVEKINKLNKKNELYKKYLSEAEKLRENGDLGKALEEYEAAKFVFDNAEIIQRIIEVKRLIKKKEEQTSKINQLVSDTKILIKQKDFQKAKEKIEEILSIDKSNTEANALFAEIDQKQKKQEKQFHDFIKTADKHLNSANYDEAINYYRQALTIKSNDDYCLLQLEEIEEIIKRQKENQAKCEKIIVTADKIFESKKWEEAKKQYERALNLCPQNSTLQSKISECNAQIKAEENAFNQLLADATFAQKGGKLKEALSLLERALNMRPNDLDVKKRINKSNFELSFISNSNSKTKPKIETKDNRDFPDGAKKPKENPKTEGDDFLGGKTGKSTSKTDDDFIAKKPKKPIDDDDFLKTKKKN
jgi:tetratricopeptide (TPR) repeat protein